MYSCIWAVVASTAESALYMMVKMFVCISVYIIKCVQAALVTLCFDANVENVSSHNYKTSDVTRNILPSNFSNLHLLNMSLSISLANVSVFDTYD